MTKHCKGWTKDGYIYIIEPTPEGSRYRYFIKINHDDLKSSLELYTNDWLTGIEKLINEANIIISKNTIRYT